MLRDASAKDDCRKELLMDIPTTDFVRAGSLEELKAKGRLVVHGPHALRQGDAARHADVGRSASR
jgi:hypothetical protein